MIRQTFAVLCAIVLLSGCAPWASYPSIETTGNLADPAYEPFPTLMARSLEYVNRMYASGRDDFVWHLPAGTSNLVYGRVASKMSTGQRRTDAMAPALHVQQVRARGEKAEVDVIFPLPSGNYRLVTLDFKHRLPEGWLVSRSRPWSIPQEEPVIEITTGAPSSETEPTTNQPMADAETGMPAGSTDDAVVGADEGAETAEP